jgi:hypothetical protein
LAILGLAVFGGAATEGLVGTLPGDYSVFITAGDDVAPGVVAVIAVVAPGKGVRKRGQRKSKKGSGRDLLHYFSILTCFVVKERNVASSKSGIPGSNLPRDGSRKSS